MSDVPRLLDATAGGGRFVGGVAFSLDGRRLAIAGRFGPTRGQVCRAIYRLDDDRLRYCGTYGPAKVASRLAKWVRPCSRMIATSSAWLVRRRMAGSWPAGRKRKRPNAAMDTDRLRRKE